MQSGMALEWERKLAYFVNIEEAKAATFQLLSIRQQEEEEVAPLQMNSEGE